MWIGKLREVSLTVYSRPVGPVQCDGTVRLSASASRFAQQSALVMLMLPCPVLSCPVQPVTPYS